MAVNKDSQAYKNLLEKGYTDEQIMDMYNEASSGKGEEVAGEEVITMGPLNANLNYYQYGDDSNPNQQGQKGGMNEKYTGEGVKTSNLEYDENIKTSDLDPNYLYGEAAKNRNSKEAGYIARRNDMIASALYNEGKTSREDVANFLASQNEWMNSTEADRLNTIESVWKRLGEMQPKEEEKPDISKMEEDLNKDTSGKIYGKTTAEEGEPTDGIKTLADDNSVYKMMNAARIATVEDMLDMGVDNLATMMYTGSNVFSEQAWRDYKKYYPDLVEQVNQKVKELRVQENVKKIASGNSNYTTVADNVNTNNEATGYAVNASTSSTQATQLLKSIDSILESNDTAKSAQDLMGSIEKDMATLKNRLRNLRAEATNAFKGDAPEYLVNAYMNNKSQEIQNQLSILEDRYNAAYNRYKTELSHAEWQAEYDLKKDSLTLEEWKAKNGVGSSTSGTSTMRTERNNNPTAMTTDVAKMLGGELGVDYEIGDAFTTSSGQTLYTAKLIGDPIETTIRLIDRGIANGIDPFYRANGQGRWSYISSIGITKDKWLKMTDAEKADVIKKMLQHEGGSMENMLYYTQGKGSDTYDITYQSAYEKFLSGDYSKAWLESQCKVMGITEQQFGKEAKAYKEAKDAGEIDIIDDVLAGGGEWVRNDGKVFDFSKSSIYKTLSERDKVAVQQLLNNSIGKQYINANRTKYDDPSGIFSAVGQIDPTWSETRFSDRTKAEAKREQGKQGGWVSRNESAMATAKELYDIAGVLDDQTIKLLGDEYNVKTLKDLANLAKQELGDTRISYLATLVYGLEEEAAGALKGGNASNSDKDIENMERLLDLGMSKTQLRAAVKGIARLLYLKDESEVRDLAALTYIKPESTWGLSVSDWMYDTLEMKDLPVYYDYTPKTERIKMTQEQEDALFDLH